MKKKELFGFLSLVESFGDKQVHPKFAYALAKNKNLVRSEVEILQKLLQPNESLSKYEEERIELCKKYADKDEAGHPKMSNTNFVITDRVGFDKDFAELREKYKIELDENDKKIAEINEILEQELEIELHHVSIKYCPSDLTPKQMDILFSIIVDD